MKRNNMTNMYDYLIVMRHGKRQSTFPWPWTSPQDHDVPLDDDAYQPIDRRAHLFNARGGVSCIISSPYKRCLQTSRHLQHTLEVPLYVSPLLSEFNFLPWSRRIEFYNWQPIPDMMQGLETVVHLHTRLEKATKTLPTKHTLWLTHGGVLSELTCLYSSRIVYRSWPEDKPQHLAYTVFDMTNKQMT